MLKSIVPVVNVPMMPGEGSETTKLVPAVRMAVTVAPITVPVTVPEAVPVITLPMLAPAPPVPPAI